MMEQCFEPLPPRRAPGVPSGALVVLQENRIWLRRDPDGSPRLPAGAAWAGRVAEHLVLGRLDALACGAAELDAAAAAAAAGLEAWEARPALEALPEAERIAAARARELLFWRKRRKFCGVCGAATEDAAADCARVCPACGAAFFPVLAPAVIVAITRGDRLLLAHNRKFRDNLHGLIAGFVETGEDAEQAVRREIREEVGIEVRNIRYFGSQSWPFPNSLMLGFAAEYAGGELRPDGVEISAADWYRIGAFPETPAPGSIAYRIIDAFVRRDPFFARPAAETIDHERNL